MIATSQKAKEIFVELVANCPPAEWEQRLESACGTDEPLRQRVRSLLNAHRDQDSFLIRPADPALATIDQVPAERPGAQIGPYKLLEQIGEGGMGLVYVAEQTEPVRRKVALKLIKPGMDTAQVIARFEAERQALAMMDHPHIAKILDAGTTGEPEVRGQRSEVGQRESSLTSDLRPLTSTAGRPFFVMELVRGLPITEYCDKARLDPRQRLKLFVDVCQAVQHAHQKGIIHRDLKPSNVMVTLHDGTPVVKVIDFGVAKAIGAQLTDRTIYTAHAQLVGTPLYMSPEQAELSGLDVDTRSDVYSLGVLLYELLTGQTPFDKDTLGKAGFDEMHRIIREDEPPRPSQRISTLNAQAISTVSQHRGLDERKLSQALRGELDWIVMKSLEKDRSRRYESASALAADIQRYLSDEPVLACPPTAMYRFQKFARKHKTALTTAAAIALCLLLGTTVSAWQAIRATAAEEQAATNEAQAKVSAQKADEKAKEATTERDEAQKQRDEVKALADKLAAKEQQLQRTLYSAHINLAHNAWNAGGLRRVNELLEQQRPKPGEPDLRGFEWHYLHKLCHPELLTLKGRLGDFASRCVAFSPDGKQLAGGHRVWNDAKKAFGAGEVLVWDSESGRQLLSCKGHSGAIYSVAFSPDGKRLASSGDGGIKVWDAQSGQEIFMLSGHTGGVRSVIFSPDGKRLASGSNGLRKQRDEWAYVGSEVKIWDAATGKELINCKGHGEIWCLAFSPDGNQLASCSYRESKDDTVKIWNAQTGQELSSINADTYLASVVFSPDGNRLYGGGNSGAKVWDVQTGQEVVLFKESKSQVNSVALSPDGKRLAATGSGAVRVWDAEIGAEIHNFKGHVGSIFSAAFNHDGTRLATASNDGTVRIWDTSSTAHAPAFSGARGGIKNLAFSSDGKLVTGSSQDPVTKRRVIKLWNAKTGQEILAIDTPKGKTLFRVVISPDGKQLAAGFGNSGVEYTQRQVSGEVKVFNAETGQEVVTFKGHTYSVVDVAFSPDSSRVISCSSRTNGAGSDDQGKPCEVKVWDANSGEELLTITGHKSFVNSVAYSPDGKRLATLSRDKTAKVWDAQTGKELLSMPAQVGMNGGVAFSPDGKRIAASNSPRYYVNERATDEIKIWDAQTGKELHTLQGHSFGVTSLAFSPDGKRLASGTGGMPGPPRGREVKLWDAETGEDLLTIEDDGSGGVAFSPDGHRLVSAGAEGLKTFDATPLPDKP